MGTIAYNQDVIEWSREQARLLRDGKWSELDIEHLADEIEDVGKSESRELEHRMTVLLVHLIKWMFQPERRGASWEKTIRVQRIALAARLNKTPSLKAEMREPDFLAVMWGDTILQAEKEMGVGNLPDACPWVLEDVLRNDFWPDALPSNVVTL